MKTPHFFKAKSRLGLINPPMRHTEINRGVEDAPDFILSSDLVAKFENSEITEYTFTKPEAVNSEKYYTVLATELKEFKDKINSSIKANQTQIVVGGDNSVTFSSFLAVIERIKDIEKIGYLQLDSHGEMHLYDTSVSKNFHGMYMRPFFDKFDIKEIENLVPYKLKTGQILTIGDMIFEEDDPKGEKAFHKKIRNINREEYINNKQKTLSYIKNFLSTYNHIHVNYDIDVYKAESVGPSGMGDEGVWLWEDTLPIIELINNKQDISLDIVEVNPKINGAERTVATAQKIIEMILE